MLQLNLVTVHQLPLEITIDGMQVQSLLPGNQTHGFFQVHAVLLDIRSFPGIVPGCLYPSTGKG